MYWSLRPAPPLARGVKGDRVALRFVDSNARREAMTLELDGPLSTGDRAYAKFSMWIDEVFLIVNGREHASIKVRRR